MTITSLAFALPIMSLLLLVRAQTPCTPTGISDFTGTCNVGGQSLTYSAACNLETIPDEDSFFGTLGNLFGNLKSATITPYKTSFAGSGGSPTAYGAANCTALSASASVCTACLTALCDSVLTICSNGLGAQLYTADCGIRYEQYDF